ncbi:hypothetical protein EDD86DRAFT_246880 [Gorgonomyces haynaldii]|nr:hypothetical protein EDD86DRAFT_246880 [Gorgonomyces haynaldii]
MSSDCLLLAVSQPETPETLYGFFVVSLTILRLFPNSLLPNLFPFGIPSYSALTGQELEQLLKQEPASQDRPSTAYGGVFHETDGFPDQMEIVERKQVKLVAVPLLLRFDTIKEESMTSLDNNAIGVSEQVFQSIAILKEELDVYLIAVEEPLEDSGMKLVIDNPPTEPDLLHKHVKQMVVQQLKNTVSILDEEKIVKGKSDQTQVIVSCLQPQTPNPNWDIKTHLTGKQTLLSYKLFTLSDDILYEDMDQEDQEDFDGSPVTSAKRDMDSANTKQAIQNHILHCKPFKSCWWQFIPLEVVIVQHVPHRRRSSIFDTLTPMFRKPSTEPQLMETCMHYKVWIRRSWFVEFVDAFSALQH